MISWESWSGQSSMCSQIESSRKNLENTMLKVLETVCSGFTMFSFSLNKCFSSKLVIFLLYQIPSYVLGRKFSWSMNICMAYFSCEKNSSEAMKKLAQSETGNCRAQERPPSSLPYLLAILQLQESTGKRPSAEGQWWSDLASTTWAQAAAPSQQQNHHIHPFSGSSELPSREDLSMGLGRK